VREVLYAELGPARRRRLHRRALALLEAEGAPAAELAWHAAAAGVRAPDAGHGVVAGAAALPVRAARDTGAYACAVAPRLTL
jgi:hypothetical protein